MKKVIGGFIAVLFLIVLIITSQQAAPNTKEAEYTIGLTQIVTHPALDEVRMAILEQLALRGYVEGENLRVIYRNANGDANLTQPIVEDFVAKNVDVIIPITTPSALSATRVAQDIPVVFSAVSYPVEVGLVESLNAPGGSVTGTSDQWPFEKQLRTYLDIVPQTQTIGMLYKPGDDVALRGLTVMQDMAERGLFTLDARPISQPSDIYPTAVDLYRSVDVIYTGIDLLVAENMGALLRAAREAQKPLLGGDSGVVESGAVMALSVGMNDIGRLTGDQVADVLGGRNPAEIPVAVVSSGELYVNEAAARANGVDVGEIREKYPDAIFVNE